MSQVTFDEVLKAKLGGFTEQVECRDEEGRIVGRFIPEDMYRRLLFASSSGAVSDEELEGRRQETGCLTTAEVLAHLRSL